MTHGYDRVAAGEWSRECRRGSIKAQEQIAMSAWASMLVRRQGLKPEPADLQLRMVDSC